MNITFIVKGDKTRHGEGFGLWFSETNPYNGIYSLIHDPTLPTALGYHGLFSGVGVGAVINSTKFDTRNPLSKIKIFLAGFFLGNRAKARSHLHPSYLFLTCSLENYYVSKKYDGEEINKEEFIHKSINL